MTYRSRAGFTLVELLVVIVIIGIVMVMFPYAITSYQETTRIDIATQTVVQALRRAQILSQAVEGDDVWGVSIQSGGVTVFQGASYATRNTDEDEAFDISTTVTPSGVSEVVFDKLTGEPQTTGTISLDTEHHSRTVNINSKGQLTYE